MRAIKPDLIMLSTCMQGQTGPHRDYPGFGNLMAALSAFTIFPATPRRSRVRPTAHIPISSRHDFPHALLSARSTIAAAPASGQYIDMAQYEAALHNLAPVLVDYFATGRVRGRPAIAPNVTLRTAPIDVPMRMVTSAGWRSRWPMKTSGTRCLPCWASPADDSRFATMRARFHDRAALDEFIGSLVRERNAEELTVALQAAGVSAYPVQNCMDLHRDENLEAFGFWQWLDHKVMGPSPYEGIEHRLERTPGELRTPAPTIGQHNDEVFGKMLGLDPAEIARLKEERVIF